MPAPARLAAAAACAARSRPNKKKTWCWESRQTRPDQTGGFLSLGSKGPRDSRASQSPRMNVRKAERRATPDDRGGLEGRGGEGGAGGEAARLASVWFSPLMR
ncbi:unnamed protein product [Merluccius merluccius]